MQADIYLRKTSHRWPSNRFVESMKFIEAIFLFTLFSYLLSPCKSNSVRDISSRLKILEPSLRSSFMRLFLGVMKSLQRRKKWEVDSIFRLQKHSGLIVSWKLCLNLCSLYPIYVGHTKYTIRNRSYKLEQRHFKYTIWLGVTHFESYSVD